MSQYQQYTGQQQQQQQQQQNHNYQQFNNFQPYPPHTFQQLNPAQQQLQYRHLPQGIPHNTLPFSNQPHVAAHETGGEQVAYPDYGNVYAAHDPTIAAQRYGAPPMHNGGAYQPGQVHHNIHPLAPIPLPKTQMQSPRTNIPPAKKMKTGKKPSDKSEDWDEGVSDDEYNMDGMKTKSGRKVHKPSQFNPATKNPSKKRGNPGAKKAVVVDSLFCKTCDRGHSPKSNLIVFCDGCNTPYHQLCHVPVIDNLLITLPDAEWFCATCDQRRAQSKLEMGYNGAELTEEQKKTYLVSLPTSHLVQLIMYANAQSPQLGLFSPNTVGILEAVRQKQEAVILAEQAKLTPVYQAVPGDEVVNESDDLQMEKRIIRTLLELHNHHAKSAPPSAETRYFTPREIFDWIEEKEVVDPSTFRVACSQQLQKSYRQNRLLKDGPGYAVNRSYNDSQLNKASSLNSSVYPGDKPNARVTGGVSTAANAALALTHDEESYPAIEGIRLPPPSSADGFEMQETDSPAFVHQGR